MKSPKYLGIEATSQLFTLLSRMTSSVFENRLRSKIKTNRYFWIILKVLPFYPDKDLKPLRKCMNLLANLVHQTSAQKFDIDFIHKICFKFLQRLDDNQNHLRVLSAKVRNKIYLKNKTLLFEIFRFAKSYLNTSRYCQNRMGTIQFYTVLILNTTFLFCYFI